MIRIHPALPLRCMRLALCLACTALAACSMLHPAPAIPAAFYALEAPATASMAVAGSRPPAMPALNLVIDPVRAAPGFDSQRIIYVRKEHKLEYFAHSEWVESPARMLGPLLVRGMEQTGVFQAVLLSPTSANADLRLDTEIVRLQQEFQTTPSRSRFTLKAYLVDEKTHRVVAWREFDCATPASREDPYAGVVAANASVQTVLSELAQFITHTLAPRQ